MAFQTKTMSKYHKYLQEIETRKVEGLHPKPIDEAAVQQKLLQFEEGWVADPSNNSTRMGCNPVGSTTTVARALCRKYGVCVPVEGQ